MRLNEKLPGLPSWPPIDFIKERDEYIVGGPHLSYRAYNRGRRTIGAIVFVALFASFGIGFTVSLGLGTVLVLLCFASMPILGIFSLFKFMCERLFSTDIQIRFKRGTISFNGQNFENAADIPVQFRAQRSPLTDEEINNNNELHRQGKLPKSRAYDYKFRKVEMIYGSRLVDITSLADEDRAQQFALALQIGYDLAHAHDFSDIQGSPVGPPRGRHLPE